LPFGLEHLGGEVDRAVAGGLGTNQAAAPVEALAGEDAGELVADRLYWPNRKPISRPPTPMSPAGTSVSGPMWRLSSVMNDWQKRMTSVSLLPLGSKSEPPLPPPMGSVVRAVLEDLLEAEELQDALVDARVEAQAALVGADGAVELDAEAAVDLDLALIVHPRHAELITRSGSSCLGGPWPVNGTLFPFRAAAAPLSVTPPWRAANSSR
jgi:hypothetical protein